MSGRIRVGDKDARTAEGIVFDSIREKEHYLQFRMLEKAGTIRKLEIQVPYVLFAATMDRATITAVPISKYIADFRVIERDGTVHIYESKGYRTAEYKRTRKWFEACYSQLRIVEL